METALQHSDNIACESERVPRTSGDYHDFLGVISDGEQRSHQMSRIVGTKAYEGGERGGLCRL